VAGSARQGKLESGAMVRIDSTVTQALMHAPQRQFSAVGCGARDGASAEARERPAWRAVDHLAQSRRLAKNRALAIQYSRGKAQKAKLYRELIAATRATVSTLEHACSLWPQAPRSKPSSGSAKSGIICL